MDDLERAIVNDYHTLASVVNRLESRLLGYRGWLDRKGGQDAYCEGKDLIWEIGKKVKKLGETLEKM